MRRWRKTGVAGRAPRVVLVGAAAWLLAVPSAHAEPYLEVRAGAKCNDCHTNQTGGGKRTAFAHIHAHDILHDLDLLPIPAGVKPFNGDINSYVSIGSDLRVRNATVFQDEGETVATNQAFRQSTTSNDTAVQEFEFYGQLDLWPDVATIYVDEDFNGGATNKEAFGLLRGFLPWDTYVKAGRFFPPFGLRVQDDDAFIRRRTGYTFDSFDEGGEIGTAPGPFFLVTSVTNGTQADKDVAVTVNGYTLLTELPTVRNVLAGASFARQSDKRNIASFYGGSNLWRFTYLGEFDLITDRTPSTRSRHDHFAAYAEVDLLLLTWLNIRGTFDFVDVSGDRNQTRYQIGTEPFINRVIQPRILYRINNGPADEPDLNTDELWFELHLFL
jgi:hypothetical protein